MAAAKCLGVLVSVTAPHEPAATFFRALQTVLRCNDLDIQNEVPLLFALGWTLTQDADHDSFSLQPFMTSTLELLQKLLDSLKSHQFLSPILQSLSLISKGYPHTFMLQFDVRFHNISFSR